MIAINQLLRSRKRRQNKKHRSAADARYLRFEALEDRRVMATFVVTSTADTPDPAPGDGQCGGTVLGVEFPCTLRAAIQEANVWPGHDIIEFNIPESDPDFNGDWWTIRLTSDLPALTDPAGVTIDGFSQPEETGPSSDPGTLGSGIIPGVADDDNQGQPLNFQTPEIAIDGNTWNAFTMRSSNNTVRGMSIYDTGKGGAFDAGPGADPGGGAGSVPGYAIRSHEGLDNVAEFMFVGVLPDGSDPAVDPLAPAVGERNRGFGAQVAPGSELTVQWSLVGHNGFGGIVGEANTSMLVAEQNEVFDNGWATDGQDGIDVNGINSIVRYNLLYMNTNLSMIPSGDSGNGIELGSKSGNAPGVLDNNIVEYNTSRDNLSAGLSIRKGPQGNFMQKNEIFGNEVGIAVDTEDGRVTRRNELSQNSIYENMGLGIDLQHVIDGLPWSGNATVPVGGGTVLTGPDGVTPNDHCDTDSGSNDLQNYPELSSALNLGSMVQFAGTLDSEPLTRFRIEFFSTPVDDMFGVGDREGRYFIGEIFVETNADCIATFNASVAGSVPEDHMITATATKDPTEDTDPWSTSEFSGPITVDEVDLSAKVTGGGWYTQQQASIPPPDATDETANFGFVAMYRKLTTADGTPVPQGNTNFLFKEQGIHFKSIEYAPASLIVTGGEEEPQNARWRGLGKLNNQPGYGFEVNLTDNGEPGSMDTWRIHIWQEADSNAFTEEPATVYENGTDATEQIINGGNLQVHMKANALEVVGTASFSIDWGTLRESYERLMQDSLTATVDHAIDQWRAAGVSEEQLAALEQMNFRAADLPEGLLGLATPNQVTIDIDADGYGWFLDTTPDDSSEFHSFGHDAQLAFRNSPASGRMDLLTAVTHELGHHLGFEHSHDHDAMHATLAPGIRLLPSMEAFEDHDHEHGHEHEQFVSPASSHTSSVFWVDTSSFVAQQRLPGSVAHGTGWSLTGNEANLVMQEPAQPRLSDRLFGDKLEWLGDRLPWQLILSPEEDEEDASDRRSLVLDLQQSQDELDYLIAQLLQDAAEHEPRQQQTGQHRAEQPPQTKPQEAQTSERTQEEVASTDQLHVPSSEFNPQPVGESKEQPLTDEELEALARELAAQDAEAAALDAVYAEMAAVDQ